MDDKTIEIVNLLWDFSKEQGGTKSALALANSRKVPRKLRRSQKLVKKVLRGWIRQSEGKPVQPIAGKHFKR